MTKDRALKRRVRARMVESGVSYSAARRDVVRWEHRRPALDDVPVEARAAVDALRATVDERMPDVVDGWYLVGSAVLGDFRPVSRDVDFVALVQRPLDDRHVEVLTSVHRDVGGRPFEGVYLTAAQLAGGMPGELLVDGREIGRQHAYSGRPVLRHELARYGVTLHGMPVEDLTIRDDVDELRAWVRSNVEDFWTGWAGRTMTLSRTGLWALLPGGLEWGALGISRMLFTVTTGDVTSKTGAGTWALQHVDRAHHAVISEALRARDGGFLNPLGALDRRARLVAYMSDAIRQIRGMPQARATRR
jgi:hypothetical protein